jgi:hypothetical protein
VAPCVHVDPIAPLGVVMTAGYCPSCDRSVALTVQGVLQVHFISGARCGGSLSAAGTRPVAARPSTAPIGTSADEYAIDVIRAEWPPKDLDASADLQAWREGMRLYENDDYASMLRAVVLLSRALAHSLYGEGILHGEDLPETIHHVLYASMETPPDGKTFAPAARRGARLALTICRENGWQPKELGGVFPLEPLRPLIMEGGAPFLLPAAIAPDGLVQHGDVKAFFAVPPQPVHLRVPSPGSEVAERVYTMMEKAQAGVR